MGTITVRLDAEDERLLDRLAAIHGDRSTVIREAIRRMSGHEERQRGLREALDAWDEVHGPIDEEGVAEYTRRFGL